MVQVSLTLGTPSGVIKMVNIGSSDGTMPSRYQAIAWTIVDLPPVKLRDIHLKTISLAKLDISTTKMYLKSKDLK